MKVCDFCKIVLCKESVCILCLLALSAWESLY